MNKKIRKIGVIELLIAIIFLLLSCNTNPPNNDPRNITIINVDGLLASIVIWGNNNEGVIAASRGAYIVNGNVTLPLYISDKYGNVSNTDLMWTGWGTHRTNLRVFHEEIVIFYSLEYFFTSSNYVSLNQFTEYLRIPRRN
ncbi:MAG: hypothetical protein FWG98_07420 [Candidatus Cloacimonetes bacterium]|nr:hypothetical protein [Candidatus Cloacimonadota bacterium]